MVKVGWTEKREGKGMVLFWMLMRGQLTKSPGSVAHQSSVFPGIALCCYWDACSETAKRTVSYIHPSTPSELEADWNNNIKRRKRQKKKKKSLGFFYTSFQCAWCHSQAKKYTISTLWALFSVAWLKKHGDQRERVICIINGFLEGLFSKPFNQLCYPQIKVQNHVLWKQIQSCYFRLQIFRY